MTLPRVLPTFLLVSPIVVVVTVLIGHIFHGRQGSCNGFLDCRDSEVDRVGEATGETRSNATAVKSVSEELGTLAKDIRGRVEGFFEKLRVA